MQTKASLYMYTGYGADGSIKAPVKGGRQGRRERVDGWVGMVECDGYEGERGRRVDITSATVTADHKDPLIERSRRGR